MVVIQSASEGSPYRIMVLLKSLSLVALENMIIEKRNEKSPRALFEINELICMNADTHNLLFLKTENFSYFCTLTILRNGKHFFKVCQ